jgi:hypothetical protein
LEDPDAWLDSDLIEIEGAHPVFDLPDFLQGAGPAAPNGSVAPTDARMK